MPRLLAREAEVLRIIVEDFIATAQPVGSRTVAKHSSLRLSPASMRNTMADLTEKGYLEQPHTSAGRVPTRLAFRLYLDTELKPRQLTTVERAEIERHLAMAGVEVSDLLLQASKMLSVLSNQVSMVISPSRDEAVWREIYFRLIRPRLVLAVLVLDSGVALNKLIEVEASLTQDELITYGNYLNEHYAGMTLSMARAMNPDSAGSQFFICVADAPFLDRQYTVFGEVISGMDAVDRIVAEQRDPRDNPLERVEMTVRIIDGKDR